MITSSDVWLLTKKIVVGIVITVVPLIILGGGLRLVQRAMGPHADSKTISSKGSANAN
jgi:hypothetical protein